MGLAIAFICATLMGFAIQRGGTCLVAAVDELVSKRRSSRLIALGEASLLVAAGKAGIDRAALRARFPRLSEAPFSSERKRMSTLHRDTGSSGGRVVFTKGAPGMLLERCTHELSGQERLPLTPSRQGQILHLTEVLAAEALRTLGAAFRSFHPQR